MHQLLARLFVITHGFFIVPESNGKIKCLLNTTERTFIGVDESYMVDHPSTRLAEGYFYGMRGFDAIANAAYELAKWNKDHGVN